MVYAAIAIMVVIVLPFAIFFYEADDEVSRSCCRAAVPSLVLLSVPFPGAMYAALRIAQTIKNTDPKIKS